MALPSLKSIGILGPQTTSKTEGISLAPMPMPNMTVAASTPQISNTNVNPFLIARDILHGITRSGAAIGLTAANKLEVEEPPKGTIENVVYKTIFGPEAIKSLALRIAEGELTAQKLGIPEKGPLGINPALLASTLGVGATVGLDFTGVGGEVKLGEKLLAETSSDVVASLLRKIKVPETLVPKYAELFAKSNKPEEVSSLLKSLVDETSGTATKLTTKETVPIATQSTKELQQAIPPSPLNITPQVTEELSSKIRIPSQAEESIGQQISGAIDRLNEAIKTATPARRKLETAYTAERSKRVGAVQGIFEQAPGQKGYFEALSKLKGELAPAEKKMFEMKQKLVENDINSLFKAAQINPRLTVFDKLNTQTALTKLLTGNIPTRSELKLLEDTYGTKLVTTVLGKQSTGQKILSGLEQIINLPRTVMSSFDLSAPLRQGLFLTSHPKAFGQSFIGMFKQFASEDAYKAVQQSIEAMNYYDKMREAKLALTDVGVSLLNREEQFLSSWAEKIPIVKHGIRASARAYTGFLNKLRADVFTEILNGVKASGRELTPELEREVARFVNIASGRGEAKALNRAMTVLNGIFFSPRLMLSRLQLLFNPLNYTKTDPVVRKEFWKSALTVLGSGLTVLSAAKMAGAKVGIDPRSSDFGKIIIGDTRIDIWGGAQQYMRMLGQLITGKYVSSTTGKVLTLGEGYKPLTRMDILARQFESKTSPVASFIIDILKQQDPTGKPINIPAEVASRFVPMLLSDLYTLAKDNPGLVPLELLGVFGVGVQTYKKIPAKQSVPKNSPFKMKSSKSNSLKGIGL